jgi:hypothetical protein
MMNETLPAMFPGAMYNYKRDVMEAIMQEKINCTDQDVFDDLIKRAEWLFGEIDCEQ